MPTSPSQGLLQVLIPGLVFLGSVRAGTVTGRVVNPLGQGVPNVKLEFSGNITPLNPVTGVNGYFNVTVPSGIYDIGFEPPVTSLAPIQIENVKVLVTANLGVMKLSPGFPISGTVLTPAKVPIIGADINVYDQATRRKLYTPSDNTSLFGIFQVVVPQGTYRVRIRPPATQVLVAQEVENLVVKAATSLGTVILPPGVLVSGTVVDSITKLPAIDVDLDARDAVTGKKIVTPNDNTNSLGRFTLILPTGLFHLSLDPPSGSSHLGKQIFNVQIKGSTNLGILALTKGLLLSGTVFGPGPSPVARVDIDVKATPGNLKIYTPNDKTDSAGKFTVVVPPGSYTVEVEPPPPLGLVGARTAKITVNANTTLPAINLQAGVVLSGTITAFNRAPEAGADLDLIQPATGVEIVTAGDETDQWGRFAMVVPKGTWDLRIQTRKLSLSRVAILKGVAITGPRTLNHQLSLVPVGVYVDTLGIPTVPQKGFVIGTLVFVNLTPTILKTTASLALVDAAGGKTYLLPPIPLPLAPFQAGALINVPIPLPPVNPAHLGKPFDFELSFSDPATGAELDMDRFKVIIQ